MTMDIVLITGMSGSGKTVALHVLEDAGYFCVDNLPPELLLPLVALERKKNASRLAIAMDVRSSSSLPQVPGLLTTMRQQGIEVKFLFLDANTDALMRRFSETRRKHPLSQIESNSANQDLSRALIDAIELERQLLSTLREHASVIDTTLLRHAQLKDQVKSLASVSGDQLTLVFESFSFKRGIPSAADYVFDVRMLPNPYYEAALKPLSGKDEAVAVFLQEKTEVRQMLDHITQFLSYWLEPLSRNHRSYITVAIGCTGGQHRSVYLVEQLAAHFESQWRTLKRHRDLGVMQQ
jgi:RNase adapter protein RapZ